MESLKAALQQFANHVVKTASVYVTVIVIFSYHVLLDKDLACTCKEQVTDCWLYMTLPAVLILVLVLWMDTTFQRALKYKCRNRKCNLNYVLCYQILKAVFLSSLWVVSVLIDGDWYVYCYNDQSEQQKLLACKDKTNITAEERGIIAALTNKSRKIGLPVLFVITILAACTSSIPRKKCCTADAEESHSCNTKVLLDEIILEEGENLVKKILRETASEQLTEKLNTYVTRKKWGECFDAAEKLIEEMSEQPAEPSASG